MAGPARIEQTPLRMDTVATEARQTPKTDFGTRLKDGMTTTAGVVASGAAVAAPLVPGGAIVSAAVSGVNSLAGSSSSGASSVSRIGMSGAYGAGGGTPATGAATGDASVPTAGNPSLPVSASPEMDGMINKMLATNMQFLMLQQQMHQENQKFSTLSNLMKVRHDTAKATIGNIH